MTFESRMAGYMSNATITALVADRAYCVNAGHSPALPYLLWQRVSTAPIEAQEPGTTLEEIGIQVTCFASTHVAACGVRRAVRSVVEANHSAGPATYGNAIDLGHDTARSTYAVACDFAIWHDDTTP